MITHVAVLALGAAAFAAGAGDDKEPSTYAVAVESAHIDCTGHLAGSVSFDADNPATIIVNIYGAMGPETVDVTAIDDARSGVSYDLDDLPTDWIGPNQHITVWATFVFDDGHVSSTKPDHMSGPLCIDPDERPGAYTELYSG